MSAVRAAAEAAELAMNAVEAAVAHYVEARDYARLKDMAEASSFAGQVRARQRVSRGNPKVVRQAPA